MNDDSQVPTNAATDSQKRFADVLKLSPKQETVINKRGIGKPSFWDKPLSPYAPTIGPNNIPGHRLTTEADGSIVVFPNRVFLSLALLGCLVFVGGSILLLLSPPHKVDTLGSLKPLLGIFLFGGFGLLYGLRLLSKEPILKLDRNGIKVNSTALLAGFIPWCDVASWKIITFRRQRMLAITLLDTATYLKNAPLLSRALLKINAFFQFAHIQIPQNMLTVPAEVLLLHMDRLSHESRNTRKRGGA